jgi:hypothetical protein
MLIKSRNISTEVGVHKVKYSVHKSPKVAMRKITHIAILILRSRSRLPVVFWVTTPYNLVGGYQLFVGIYCLYLP